jgi:hypothetical protein
VALFELKPPLPMKYEYDIRSHASYDVWRVKKKFNSKKTFPSFIGNNQFTSYHAHAGLGMPDLNRLPHPT